MTQKEIKYNSLNLRGISNITPPPVLTLINKIYSARRYSQTTLLHRAFAPCSRAFLCLMSGIILFVGAGCSKDDISQMHLMYNESRGLPSTSIDSVKTFTTKFSNYLKTNPEGWKDEYCNPTIENMKYACTVFGYKLEVTTVAFRFNTEWGEGQTIYFD